MTKSIDIKASLQFGWDTLKANTAFFLKLLALLIAVSIVPTMLVAKISTAAGAPLALPLQCLNFAWQAIIGIGVLKIMLKLYDRQPVELSDVWSGVPQTLDYIIVKILFSLIVGVGLVLLVVPGLIWAMQFYFASYLVVDRGVGAIKALKGSSIVTKGAKIELGIFASVVLVLNILGMIFFVIGLLVTLPVTILAGVHVYRKLLEQTEASGSLIPAK